MAPGKDHLFQLSIRHWQYGTPVIKFGEQFNDSSKVADNIFLPANAKLKIRLDMRAGWLHLTNRVILPLTKAIQDIQRRF